MYIDDIKEIEHLIKEYFEGIYYGDSNKLQKCFHENVYIYGDIKGADYLKSISDYIDGVNNRKSPQELNEEFAMKIIGIDVLGKVAMAKLHVPMLGYNYYDYISLSKIGDQWKMVNKVFTHVNE